MRNVIRCGNLLSGEFLRFLQGGVRWGVGGTAVTRSGCRDVNISMRRHIEKYELKIHQFSTCTTIGAIKELRGD